MYNVTLLHYYMTLLNFTDTAVSPIDVKVNALIHPSVDKAVNMTALFSDPVT